MLSRFLSCILTKPTVWRFKYIPAEDFRECVKPKSAVELTNGDPSVVSWTDVINYASRLFSGFDVSRCFISDEWFAVWGAKDVYDFLTEAGVYKIPYNPNRFDCEDFSLKARAELSPFFPNPSFGIVWLIHPTLNVGHAMNWCILSTRDGLKTYFYEPQLNEFYEKLEVNWRFYMTII